MRVVWTPEAQQDRSDVWDYIAAENPRAAARMDELFSDAATLLAQHPHRGKPGRILGTRELIPHESYRLVYQIDGETVWILTLVHTARLWPPVRD
ncbi:type II toxin-antitoxin system RelE/ParE family toxin [Candidatus Accumulibacter phosphatis]|uniref:Type II toxin-antitoxin system RelE/ParE family toxin n=1 Tax=Candidatus Accumulibacter phosphatis TaxID=327160 RepID=A0ABX1U4Z8_9PROT|nr:type II toxin-antitoxin system RelE/ParE family toxin [Candidatus Accumulibacter phosphatis]